MTKDFFSYRSQHQAVLNVTTVGKFVNQKGDLPVTEAVDIYY